MVGATIFTNRQDELSLINDALNDLGDRKCLLRTPIIEFFGVNGIGKSTLLKRVATECRERSIPYVYVNAENIDRSTPVGDEVTEAVLRQIEEYAQVKAKGHLSQTITDLLKQQPLAMILDSLDIADEDLLDWIEANIPELVDEGKLFVVLGSKRFIGFEKTRPMARKIRPYLLAPFDKEDVSKHLEAVGPIIEPEVVDIIFDWTSGYPQAVSVMSDAITEGQLDPRKEEDRRELLATMSAKIVDKVILADVDPAHRERYKAILSILSVPRRFNLVIMQELVEKFAPDYRLPSSLDYMGLVKEIRYVTGLLDWDVHRSGYALVAPLRSIFVLDLRFERTDVYQAIHNTLATMYEGWLETYSGPDQVRFLIEFVYHSAHVPARLPKLVSRFEKFIHRINDADFDLRVQLLEELSHDTELKNILGFTMDEMITIAHNTLGLGDNE